MSSEEIRQAFRKRSFVTGRMISYSKSSYKERNPGHDVLFNANIFVLGTGKVWWGDLDITKDFDELHNIAKELGKDIYILRELDGRFENENIDDTVVINKAHVKIPA